MNDQLSFDCDIQAKRSFYFSSYWDDPGSLSAWLPLHSILVLTSLFCSSRRDVLPPAPEPIIYKEQVADSRRRNKSVNDFVDSHLHVEWHILLFHFIVIGCDCLQNTLHFFYWFRFRFNNLPFVVEQLPKMSFVLFQILHLCRYYVQVITHPE